MRTRCTFLVFSQKPRPCKTQSAPDATIPYAESCYTNEVQTRKVGSKSQQSGFVMTANHLTREEKGENGENGKCPIQIYIE